MPPTKRIRRLWDPQLSPQEVQFIGEVFIQWSSMEHEVFMQTLLSYEAEVTSANQLPKAINNIQFTGVLDLWRERVATKAPGRRGKVLVRQYDEILRLKGARDALAHGMWHWHPSDLGIISTVRVRKREIITSHFSASTLSQLAKNVAEVNFKLRFPGGLIDLAKARMEQGGYISRRAMAMVSGASCDALGYPVSAPSGKRIRARRKADA